MPCAALGPRGQSTGALRGREGSWQQALETEGPEGPGPLGLSSRPHWTGCTGRWALKAAELSRHVGPVPVTRWGTVQEGQHHISRVFFSQPQNDNLQPGIHSDMGHQSLVNAFHHGWYLGEAWGRLGRRPREQLPSFPSTIL